MAYTREHAEDLYMLVDSGGMNWQETTAAAANDTTRLILLDLVSKTHWIRAPSLMAHGALGLAMDISGNGGMLQARNNSNTNANK